MVVNRANKPVLLIDGEELAGAKQNRVLNTSILIKEVSETKIPVSCTEQGRWSYASKAFSESGNVMAYKSRSRKTRSVHQSLEACGAPMSDQGEVWDGIAELQAKACASSPTSAMSDVYKAREDDLRKCDEIFKPVANQVGLLAFIGGQPAGADMVSLTVRLRQTPPQAGPQLHPGGPARRPTRSAPRPGKAKRPQLRLRTPLAKALPRRNRRRRRTPVPLRRPRHRLPLPHSPLAPRPPPSGPVQAHFSISAFSFSAFSFVPVPPWSTKTKSSTPPSSASTSKNSQAQWPR